MSEYPGKYWYIVDGRTYLTRCPKCGLENWAPAVASGKCAWCGYTPELPRNTHKLKKEE